MENSKLPLVNIYCKRYFCAFQSDDRCMRNNIVIDGYGMCESYSCKEKIPDEVREAGSN